MAESLSLPAGYGPLLAKIKARVQTARIKAGLAANRELLALYWDIGRLILQSQESRGYGKKVVERLAADLQRAFPGVSGFSSLNVWRMRAFYAAYATVTPILSPPVTESGGAEKLSPRATDSDEKPVASLPPEPFASFGLILCRSKDRVIAEYALRDLNKPIGVSDYVTRLVDSLPDALQGNVPSVAELEQALSDNLP